jgi:pyruvate formate-lyase activating enzyme-like uncharacterized protein
MEYMEADSAFVGLLPKGCELCRRGSKMVLLITGKCRTGCFYCPLSGRKKGQDVMFANELLVDDVNDILEEARLIDAEGTGITGGDPLWDLKKSVRIVGLLKDAFGTSHHIHLYTSTIDGNSYLRLEEAGLDEIRVHPPLALWDRMETTELEGIRRSIDMDIGLEVPLIPGEGRRLRSLIEYANEIDLDFINLNELEFSETNWEAFLERSFEVKDDISSAVRGSEELGMEMLRLDLGISRHYCSSSFKDRIQLRKRIMRRAENVALPLDIITEEGTLYKGVIESQDLEGVISLLVEGYDVPDDLVRIDLDKGRVEVAPWVLEEIAQELKLPAFLVEEYPTADRLEVEREPLNDSARSRPR